MKKTNEEWDIEIESWLKVNDPIKAKDRTYLTQRQMRRRQKREIPISQLPKGLAHMIENEVYSTLSISDHEG